MRKVNAGDGRHISFIAFAFLLFARTTKIPRGIGLGRYPRSCYAIGRN